MLQILHNVLLICDHSPLHFRIGWKRAFVVVEKHGMIECSKGSCKIRHRTIMNIRRKE